MKKVMIAILVSGLIGCGMYEEEININSSSDSLMMLARKVEKGKKLTPPSVSNLIRRAEISVSDDPSKLFTENANSEFSISSVMDINIAGRFSFYSGIHNIGIRVYLPDGSLYINASSDVNFDTNFSYSSNSIIIENSESVLTARYIMPVAGTEIAIFMLTGRYKSEIYIDGNKVAEKEFFLK
ncbi:MAG: hypothetical protein N3B13_00440 [Deltaproteobacteria bacterium]|nr:hypothetical protein [Deltaproteobacteria bacterium]